MIDAMNSTVISGTPRTELDVGDRDRADDRQRERRPSASRMPSGKAKHGAEDGEHQRDRQAAPQRGGHRRQAEAAGHQPAAQQRAADPQQRQAHGLPEQPQRRADDHRAEDQHRRRRAPLLGLGVDAEQHLAPLVGDDRPAGALPHQRVAGRDVRPGPRRRGSPPTRELACRAMRRGRATTRVVTRIGRRREEVLAQPGEAARRRRTALRSDAPGRERSSSALHEPDAMVVPVHQAARSRARASGTRPSSERSPRSPGRSG